LLKCYFMWLTLSNAYGLAILWLLKWLEIMDKYFGIIGFMGNLAMCLLSDSKCYLVWLFG
jgi:hypothetical protein